MVRFIEVKRSKKPVRKTESVENKYEMSLSALNEIPDQKGTVKELWLWVDKEGIAGEKKYQPAHWEKFVVTRNGFHRRK